MTTPPKALMTDNGKNWQNRIVGYKQVPAHELLANPMNARHHPNAQREALRGSLDTLGWVAPVLVNINTNMTIDGHARIEEILSRDENALVPVIEVDLSEHEEKLFLASFDWITQLATYDSDRLDSLLREVQTDDTRLQTMLAEMANENELYDLLEQIAPDIDLSAYGIGETQDPPEAQIDKAQELQEKWQVKKGDLFQIGKHRLLCGDSTNEDDVKRLMGGDKADAVVTDPPYGTASNSKVQKRGERIETFNIEWDGFYPFEWIATIRDFLISGCAVITFCENAGVSHVWDYFKKEKINPLHTIYWEKTIVPQPRPNFCSCVETAIFARTDGTVRCWNGGGATANIFKFNRASGNERTPHETQKPLSLFSEIIKLITNQGMLVYDPFAGSGTTAVACEQLNRQCRMMEIEEKYCSVILERLSDMGLSPELIESKNPA